MERPRIIQLHEYFSIAEHQDVTELDSPNPGLDFTIARKDALHEFFASQESAQQYLDDLISQYCSANKTLALYGNELRGDVGHLYSHAYTIRFAITPLREPTLSPEVETLLAKPRRRVLSDTRSEPPTFSRVEPYRFTLF